MNQNSESLLTQILLLVQDIHVNLSEFDRRLCESESAFVKLSKNLEEIAIAAFPEGPKSHGDWHSKNQAGPVKRFLRKMLS